MPSGSRAMQSVFSYLKIRRTDLYVVVIPEYRVLLGLEKHIISGGRHKKPLSSRVYLLTDPSYVDAIMLLNSSTIFVSGSET